MYRYTQTIDNMSVSYEAATVDELKKLVAAFDDDGGWIEWGGGECPVSGDTYVEAMLRNGFEDTAKASEWNWKHDEEGGDIVAYRVVK